MNGADVVPGEPDTDRLIALGQHVADQLALDCVLADVVREFESRGIESLLLKGPALARWLYEDENERAYGDIDLLVAPAQFDDATRCLEKMGFSGSEADRHPHEKAEHHDIWLSPGPYAGELELHRTLFLLTVPPGTVWQHLNAGREAIEIAGAVVQIPRPTARALIVALHAAQHGRSVSRPIQDLERATTRVDPAVWREAVLLARELRCLPAFAAGLHLSPEGRQLARKLGIASEPSSRFLRLLGAGAPDTAVGIETLLTTRGFTPRVRLLWEELFPSAGFMRGTYHLAEHGRLGLITAYLIRPVRLVLKLPRGVAAWLRAAIPFWGNQRPGRAP